MVSSTTILPWEFSYASCREKQHEESCLTCSGLEETGWREIHSGQRDLDAKIISLLLQGKRFLPEQHKSADLFM